MTSDIMLDRAEYPLSEDVFELHAHSFPTNAEANLVRQLTNDGDLILSIGARRELKLVGHLVLSAMQAPFPVLGLAPLAVHADHQRQGIAALLLKDAINFAKEENWFGIFVLGDPAFYEPYGFLRAAAEQFKCRYQGPYLMYFPLKSLPQKFVSAEVNYAWAFDTLD